MTSTTLAQSRQETVFVRVEIGKRGFILTQKPPPPPRAPDRSPRLSRYRAPRAPAGHTYLQARDIASDGTFVFNSVR